MLQRGIRALQLRAADLADAARGRRDRLTPPRRYLDFVGNSDFQATGEEFLEHFRALADLKPTDRVLDVGCGIGRMARVLSRELRAPGSYDGFDISANAIAWCRRHYERMPVPFTFRHADLRNTLYNPGGRGSPADYRFPYLDRSFDLVIATSVFTHLLEDGAENYLAQAARVLAPGGRLFTTWFLLGADATPPGSDDAAFNFSHARVCGGRVCVLTAGSGRPRSPTQPFPRPPSPTQSPGCASGWPRTGCACASRCDTGPGAGAAGSASRTSSSPTGGDGGGGLGEPAPGRPDASSCQERRLGRVAVCSRRLGSAPSAG